MNIRRKLFRYWYYYRIGYGTYLSYVLGFVSTIITVYYLFIKAVPSLQIVFPSFWIFTAVGFFVGVPSCIGFGFAHFKRTRAYSSESDIGAESYPYNYKPPPGFNRTVMMPLYIELLTQLKQIRLAQGNLTYEEKFRIENIEGMLRKLQNGEVA